MWNWADVDFKIESVFRQERLPMKDLKYVQFGAGEYFQVIPMEEEFTEFLKRYFDILSIYEDRSHPAMEFKRAFILKPKEE